MKVNAKEFYTHVEIASLGGLINEVVLGDGLKYAITDDARAVMVAGGKTFPGEISNIGLFDLQKFLKAIKYAEASIYASGEELEITLQDNRLLFSKGGNEIQFLLSNPAVIASTVNNIEGTFKKIESKKGYNTLIQQDVVDKYLSAVAIFDPTRVRISVVSGKAYFILGAETEHSVKIAIGNTEAPNMNFPTYPAILKNLMLLFKLFDEVTMTLREELGAVVFTAKDYVFVLSKANA